MKSDEFKYRSQNLGNVIGVSRSTLHYYEKIGVLKPERDESSDYRSYTNDDVNRAVAFSILRTAGVSAGEAAEKLEKADWDLQEFLDQCERANASEVAWHAAVAQRIASIKKTFQRQLGEPFVQDVEAWTFYPNQAEPGGIITRAQPFTARIFSCAPVSATATLYSEPEADGTPVFLWGNAVPSRYIPLVGCGLEKDVPNAVELERGRYLCITTRLVKAGSGMFCPEPAVWETLFEWARKARCKLVWPALLCDYTPVSDGVYAVLRIGIAGTDIFSKAMLSRAVVS